MHGRGRKADSLEDTYFGVHQEQLYARKLKPVEGTQTLPFRGRKLGHFCILFKMKMLYLCCLIFIPPSVAGAQWTGIVTTIAIEMLKSNMVEAVVCVQR